MQGDSVPLYFDWFWFINNKHMMIRTSVRNLTTLLPKGMQPFSAEKDLINLPPSKFVDNR